MEATSFTKVPFQPSLLFTAAKALRIASPFPKVFCHHTNASTLCYLCGSSINSHHILSVYFSCNYYVFSFYCSQTSSTNNHKHSANLVHTAVGWGVQKGRKRKAVVVWWKRRVTKGDSWKEWDWLWYLKIQNLGVSKESGFCGLFYAVSSLNLTECKTQSTLVFWQPCGW